MFKWTDLFIDHHHLAILPPEVNTVCVYLQLGGSVSEGRRWRRRRLQWLAGANVREEEEEEERSQH